jgi:hypothetical protein
MGNDLSPGQRDKILMAVKKLKENSSLYSNECSDVLNFTPILREYEHNKKVWTDRDGLPRVHNPKKSVMPYYPRDEI